MYCTTDVRQSYRLTLHCTTDDVRQSFRLALYCTTDVRQSYRLALDCTTDVRQSCRLALYCTTDVRQSYRLALHWNTDVRQSYRLALHWNTYDVRQSYRLALHWNTDARRPQPTPICRPDGFPPRGISFRPRSSGSGVAGAHLSGVVARGPKPDLKLRESLPYTPLPPPPARTEDQTRTFQTRERVQNDDKLNSPQETLSLKQHSYRFRATPSLPLLILHKKKKKKRSQEPQEVHLVECSTTVPS